MTTAKNLMHSRKLPLLGLVLATVSGCDTAMVELPPIAVSGSLGNTVRTRDIGSQPREYSEQVTASLHGNSYIWQPWFMTARAGATLGFETTSGGVRDGDTLIASGEIDLGILPLSKYPATINYSRTDSRADGTLGADFVRNSISLSSQAIITEDIRTIALVGYHDIDQPGEGQEVARKRLADGQ